MKSITKIIMAILFVQLFNLNAADNGEYKYLNLQFLPQEMKNEILGFLGNPNAIPESQTLEKIKELQKLALVNKDLSKLAQDALRKYEKRTNEYLNGLIEAGTNPLEAALTLKTPFAAKWLKDKAAEIEPLQLEINQNLIKAAEDGHKDTVKFLISAGANINIQDKYGDTALMRAAQGGHKDIVELLINAKANLNIQGNRYEETALMLAAIFHYKDIVNMLISAGADLNIQNKDGVTALILTIKTLLFNKEGYKDIIELLISNKAKLNIQDKYGDTALMWAVKEGDKYIVELLISSGADLNIQNKKGKTALDIAKSEHNKNIVKLLEEAKSKKS